MKRVGKVLLALMALMGVVIVGGIWLFDKTLNVVTDAVDNSLSSTQKVQSAQNSAQTPSAGVENAPDALTKPGAAGNTSTTLSASNATNQPAIKEANKNNNTPVVPTVQTAKNNPNRSNAAEKDDPLGDFGGLVRMFLTDGDDALDPTALLTSGDKVENGDKPASANGEESLTDMIPGANSPTVKRWMAGKYKGKEGQVFDDAIEDPKLWRLFFSLSGGM